MSAVCPNGHTSGAEDFCDTCGAKIDLEQPAGGCGGADPRPLSGPRSSAAGESGCCGGGGARSSRYAPTARRPTPRTRCSARRVATTSRPARCRGARRPSRTRRRPTVRPPRRHPRVRSPRRIPLEWVAEVWVDPQWYAVQEAEEPMPSPGLPAVVGLTARSLLIGRVSPSRNIHPDIDCTSDTGRQPPARPADDRRPALVRRGPRLVQRDLRRARVGTVAGGPDRRGATDRARRRRPDLRRRVDPHRGPGRHRRREDRPDRLTGASATTPLWRSPPGRGPACRIPVLRFGTRSRRVQPARHVSNLRWRRPQPVRTLAQPHGIDRVMVNGP